MSAPTCCSSAVSSSTRSIESRPRSSSRLASGVDDRARLGGLSNRGQNRLRDRGAPETRGPPLPEPGRRDRAWPPLPDFTRRSISKRLILPVDVRGSGVHPDLVAEHALVVRQVDRGALHLEADDVADVGDLPLAQHLVVGDDDGVQPLGGRLARPREPEHAEFLDERRLAVDGLDLFRVDVLARAEDDQLLLAAGDRQPALVVQPPEVARVQPAVAQASPRWRRAG